MHSLIARPPDPAGATPDPGAPASAAACAARADEHLQGDRTVAAAEIHRRGGEEPRRHHPHRLREKPAAHSGGGAVGSDGEGRRRRRVGFESPASPRARATRGKRFVFSSPRYVTGFNVAGVLEQVCQQVQVYAPPLGGHRRSDGEMDDAKICCKEGCNEKMDAAI
jgi:hypothetical protein